MFDLKTEEVQSDLRSAHSLTLKQTEYKYSLLGRVCPTLPDRPSLSLSVVDQMMKSVQSVSLFLMMMMMMGSVSAGPLPPSLNNTR